VSRRLVAFPATISIWVEDASTPKEAVAKAAEALGRVGDDVCVSGEVSRGFFVEPSLEDGWIEVED
jgi:hypothetical protein